jgi:Fe2+ transport system protein B
MSDDYASKEDVQSILKAMGESTSAISNLAIKLEHQSSLIEASEKRNDKRIEKLEIEAKEDRKSSAESRKEMHKEIAQISGRLMPVESITTIMKTIATRIIGTLITMFVVGGVGMFVILKILEAAPK